MPIAQSVKMGEGVRVFYPDLVNMYNCSLGAQTTVGPFVEVQGGVEIGASCEGKGMKEVMAMIVDAKSAGEVNATFLVELAVL